MKSARWFSIIIVCISFTSLNAFSQGGACKMGSLPTVMFPPGSSTLTKSAINILNKVAEDLKNNPGCNLKVTGYGGTNKKSQQLSWEHVYAIIMHLNEKQNISLPRLIFIYGEQGGPDASVDLIATSDVGPSISPAPHPQLRRH